MKTVCIIGPLPPPVNGNSKALDTIINSAECKKNYRFLVLNLSEYYKSGVSGSISLGKIGGIIRVLGDLKKFQKENQIDTYYLSNAQSTGGVIRDILILRQIKRNKKNSKVVIHLHGGGFKQFYSQSNQLIKWLTKKYYGVVDVAIVLGESLKDMFEGIISDNKIRVIPNCVDDKYLIDKMTFDRKIENILNNRPIKVLYLSNMVETKGYNDVFLAAKKCLEMGINTEFIFAGNFEAEKRERKFRNEIERSGYGNRITYLGIVQGRAKVELLTEADIFVLPTYYPFEGQPISIIEAMGAGMPIITTNHAGIKDLVKDGVNGLFVEAKSPEDICSKLISLMDDKKKIKDMATSNRKLVLEQYMEDNYLSNIMNIL